MNNIVPIFDSRVQAVEVLDVLEPLRDVRLIHGLYIDRTHAADPTCFYWVRQNVAKRLLHVLTLLPNGLTLKFFEGLRPVAAQQQLIDMVYKDVARAHPDWAPDQVRAKVALFIAPAKGTSPHCSGAAVDLTLCDANGVELDMGTAVNETSTRSYTASADISPQAREYRRILCHAMQEAGFINYPAEWWHWSYGDQYWAFMSGETYALYGEAPVPVQPAVDLLQV